MEAPLVLETYAAASALASAVGWSRKKGVVDVIEEHPDGRGFHIVRYEKGSDTGYAVEPLPHQIELAVRYLLNDGHSVTTILTTDRQP